VWYDKKYYPVSVPGFSDNDGDIHVPELTKALTYRHYLTGGKTAWTAGGEIIAREFTGLQGEIFPRY
jgi:hypothetical protein